MPKIKLLDSVLLPKVGTKENIEHPAGDTVEVPEAVAKRFIALGVAEKP